jgi:AcrR family transcriptional regulator
LNVFKTYSAKGGETQQRILNAALTLFRDKGFDVATMRDIAAAAGQSLGAAYHYFPSKEAIVLAYYARVQQEHDRVVAEALAHRNDLRSRIAAVVHSKLDILANDRPLMGALLRYTGQPAHALSFLGSGTRDFRLRSIALFRQALAHEKLPDDLRLMTPILLWAMHMGLLLYFLYDDSPQQHRTRTLADGAIDLVVRTLSLARLAILKPIRRSVADLLDQAGLLVTEAP